VGCLAEFWTYQVLPPRFAPRFALAQLPRESVSLCFAFLCCIIPCEGEKNAQCTRYCGCISGFPRDNACGSNDRHVIKKAVVFIYASDGKGEVDKSRQLGTRFLISIPKKDDSTFFYHTLVTARHIVDPVWAGCGATNPARIFIRVNRTGFDPSANESGVSYLPIDLLKQGKPTWSGSKDEHVDAAVLDAPEGLAGNEVMSINYRNFGTPEEIKKLAIGSDVASAGLVPGLQGVRRNYPIFKFGKIASIPDEMATLKCTKDSFTTPIRIWWLAMKPDRRK
jgi:hypothetical protein